MKEPEPDALILTPQFTSLLGAFQTTWSTIELLTDYAIYKFLKITPEQAHLITSGMMFGRKARLLADLIGRSDHPNKAAIQGTFNKIRGDNKRDVIAHSYQASSKSFVRFVERSSGGEYKAKIHQFTYDEFRIHVNTMSQLSKDLWKELGATPDEVVAFAEASFSANRSASTSPQNPDAKA